MTHLQSHTDDPRHAYVEQSVLRLPCLSSATVVARSESAIDAEIDCEVVILTIENGTCYGLNRIGSRIWGILAAAPIRVGDICEKLLIEYRVEPSICEQQVIDLLERLRAEGL